MRIRSRLNLSYPLIITFIALCWMSHPALADRAPLPAIDLPGMYQRVLTLPDATLHQEPNGSVVEHPPVFSVMYVYDRREFDGDNWLEVGQDTLGRSNRFIRADQAEDWHHMLVMRFAPRGLRSRVMFFRDRATLADLTKSVRNRSIIASLEADLRDGRPDRNILAAVEPATAVKYEDQPYLFPILNYFETRVGLRDRTTLVNIAGLNTTAADQGKKFDDVGSGLLHSEFMDMRHGVVFVVDTTRSMKPYIDRISAVIGETYNAFEQAGGVDKVSFGLVAFRDNITPDPRIGYVTEIALPIRSDNRAEDVLGALKNLDVSPVSTQGWDEDAFAGLNEALRNLDWSDFDARLIVLVTDAAARSGNDPMAKFPGIDVHALKEEAKAKHIAIMPIHLTTDEAQRAGNLLKAQRQYRALGRAGDIGIEKYIAIPAKPVDAFNSAIKEFSAGLVEATIKASQGRYALSAGNKPRKTGGYGVKDMVVNEIFRAQLEYLGEQKKTQSPRFYRAWASDHDLTKPNLTSLEVNVFLTRTQLSALGNQLKRILDLAKEGKTSSERFFSRLQDLATRTSYDPSRVPWTQDQTIGDAGLLPAYLSKLPYRSDVLNLSESAWLSYGLTGQQEFIDNLEFKLTAYENIATFDSWVDLGASDIGLEVYPVPLSLLP